MTFTKLFTSITESTIWVAPDAHRLCWITMLAMADNKGRVWASVPGLANRARIQVDDCRSALASFMAPDPDSRTKDHDGRRIEEIDGGWKLLNHAKYRAIRDHESILESKRKYINTRRAVENVDRGRHIAEAEAESLKPKSTTLAPDATRRAPKQNGHRISFDPESGAFKGLTEDDELRWQDAYPAVPIPPAISQAAAWLKANPANRKSNCERFLVNWFKREQDKAPRVKR